MNLRITPSLVQELKSPLGRLETDMSVAGGRLITVGDVVTLNAIKAGKKVWVAVCDGRAMRRAFTEEGEIKAHKWGRTERVKNEAGTITEEAVHAITAALQRKTTTLIEVDGEEDLLALPCIRNAPDGATVIYGQPEKGIVYVTVNEEAKNHAQQIMNLMEAI